MLDNLFNTVFSYKTNKYLGRIYQNMHYKNQQTIFKSLFISCAFMACSWDSHFRYFKCSRRTLLICTRTFSYNTLILWFPRGIGFIPKRFENCDQTSKVKDKEVGPTSSHVPIYVSIWALPLRTLFLFLFFV